MNNNNNGLFDLAAIAGLDAQSTYILHIEPKYKKNENTVQCSAGHKKRDASQQRHESTSTDYSSSFTTLLVVT